MLHTTTICWCRPSGPWLPNVDQVWRLIKWSITVVHLRCKFGKSQYFMHVNNCQAGTLIAAAYACCICNTNVLHKAGVMHNNCKARKRHKVIRFKLTTQDLSGRLALSTSTTDLDVPHIPATCLQQHHNVRAAKHFNTYNSYCNKKQECFHIQKWQLPWR